MYKPTFTSIKSLHESAFDCLENNVYTIKGWVRSVRKQANILFIQVYDGSYALSLQALLLNEGDKKELFSYFERDCSVGACIYIDGVIKKSPAKGQLFELHVNEGKVIGKVENPATYLPSVKGVSLEKLRETQHLRSKFKSFGCIYRVRSMLSKAVHSFFEMHNFHHLDPNVITSHDCEGAGEVFTITTLLKDKGHKETDFSKDFFQKQAFLTVSSQLQLEAICAGMGGVYTTNPSFRAEQSKTRRHMASFTHLEWEIPFIELKDLMDFTEDLIKYCIKSVLDKCKEDVQELDSFLAKGLIDKLNTVVNNEFERISYTKAISLVKENKDNILKKFGDAVGADTLPVWGDDLGSYCERYICEEIYKKPVCIYNYPKSLKSFYMKQNVEGGGSEGGVKGVEGEGEWGETVQGVDVIVNGIGELVGSSIREENYDLLVKEMDNRKMNKEDYEWYIDLRKNGTFPHGGAGLGFDRLVSFCTSMEGNIREAVPFPVCYQECNY
jgi:asparaginyl-tRNA synthetase